MKLSLKFKLCVALLQVNAGSTVRMVFMNGAYVLRDVHGRDAETLQKGSCRYVYL